MKTILISGKSGSGKDTVAQMMREQLQNSGLRVLTIHYADLVKFYAHQYYDWNGVKDEQGRTLLQHLGTDTVRKQYPEYWSEAVAKFISAVDTDFDVALVPDARFPNEIEITKKYNPNNVTVRIERYNTDGSPWLNALLTEEQHNHPSETSLDNYAFDYTIINNAKNLIDLGFIVDEFVHKIFN